MTFRTLSELVHVAGGPGLPRDLDRDRCDLERKLLFSGDAPSSRSTVAYKEAHGRWASAGHSSSRKKIITNNMVHAAAQTIWRNRQNTQLLKSRKVFKVTNSRRSTRALNYFTKQK